MKSPRAQIDRTGYQRGMKQVLESEPNIRLIQQEIVGLLVDNGVSKVSLRQQALLLRICVILYPALYGRGGHHRRIRLLVGTRSTAPSRGLGTR